MLSRRLFFPILACAVGCCSKTVIVAPIESADLVQIIVDMSRRSATAPDWLG
jgi:hypothetical protein